MRQRRPWCSLLRAHPIFPSSQSPGRGRIPWAHHPSSKKTPDGYGTILKLPIFLLPRQPTNRLWSCTLHLSDQVYQGDEAGRSGDCLLVPLWLWPNDIQTQQWRPLLPFLVHSPDSNPGTSRGSSLSPGSSHVATCMRCRASWPRACKYISLQFMRLSVGLSHAHSRRIVIKAIVSKTVIPHSTRVLPCTESKRAPGPEGQPPEGGLCKPEAEAESRCPRTSEGCTNRVYYCTRAFQGGYGKEFPEGQGCWW